MTEFDPQKFRELNIKRCEIWHGDNMWDHEMWCTAILGEIGEAANTFKKIKRASEGLVGNKDADGRGDVLWREFHIELADIYTYTDIAAHCLGARWPLRVNSVTRDPNGRHETRFRYLTNDLYQFWNRPKQETADFLVQRIYQMADSIPQLNEAIIHKFNAVSERTGINVFYK